MERVWRLNRVQRVVLVVAIGVVLAVGVAALTHEWSPSRGGWFAYAPNTGVAFPDDSISTWPIWRDALTWIGATVLWCGISIGLLRSDPPSSDE